ncbi:MAG TPA: hypothetical protein PLU71_01460 [Candidatus Dependentiae bacterium]|nr:hypothetical protein [Candidatus Dependentiae bacterium]HRQ62499.1 hypothetical protein [Candidatus Dependentiae bacterium]
MFHNYARWLEDESYGFYEAANLNNFVFIGTNKVFEVLAGYKPEVVLEEMS